jgi:hypothetical protein
MKKSTLSYLFCLKRKVRILLKDLLVDDGEHIIYNGSYMEAYIPQSYFDKGLAENFGTSLKVFGVFNARSFTEKNVPMKLETFNAPTMIYLYPIEIEIRQMQLIEDENGTVDTYQVAKFYKGGKVMANKVPQDVGNIELFLGLLFEGNIPTTIPYSQVIQLWHKNLQLNGQKLGVTSTIFEVIINQIYRNKKKPEEPFAKVMGQDPSASEYGYSTANIREICARNSTFAALTFEDMDSMITSSLNINKYNKQETQSPIEKIIKM